MMVDIFKNSGKIALVNEALKIFVNGIDMDFEIDFINLFGMLLGPTALLVSSLEIINSIS